MKVKCDHCYTEIDTKEMYVVVPELKEYYHVECFYETHTDLELPTCLNCGTICTTPKRKN